MIVKVEKEKRVLYREIMVPLKLIPKELQLLYRDKEVDYLPQFHRKMK